MCGHLLSLRSNLLLFFFIAGCVVSILICDDSAGSLLHLQHLLGVVPSLFNPRLHELSPISLPLLLSVNLRNGSDWCFLFLLSRGRVDYFSDGSLNKLRFRLDSFNVGKLCFNDLSSGLLCDLSLDRLRLSG